MFSEALRILDRNTAELMPDRYKSQLEATKQENANIKAEADARIAELEAQLNQLKKQQ